MTSLQEENKKIKEKLVKEFNLANQMAVPGIEKVVVNMGIGEAAQDKKIIEKAADDLQIITGQKAKLNKARVAISTFKLRKDDVIGLKVTLRGKRMYNFLEKLFKIVLPRLRDFHGVAVSGFDGRGNYNLGISEQIIFPEIDYSKIDKIRGLQITIVTSTDDNQKAKRLLEELGMPFAKDQKNG